MVYPRKRECIGVQALNDSMSGSLLEDGDSEIIMVEKSGIFRAISVKFICDCILEWGCNRKVDGCLCVRKGTGFNDVTMYLYFSHLCGQSPSLPS